MLKKKEECNRIPYQSCCRYKWLEVEEVTDCAKCSMFCSSCCNIVLCPWKD